MQLRLAAERGGGGPRRGADTAESHRANLMRKLGLRNQTALVRYTLQRVNVSIEGGSG